MASYKVKSTISHGVRDKDNTVVTKEYLAGSTISLTSEEAKVIGFALEDAPVDESIPESTRLRPDNKDSGVAALHKVDRSDTTAAESNAVALQNVLDSPSAEFSDAPLAEDLEKLATTNAAPKPVPKVVTKPVVTSTTPAKTE